MHPNPESMRGVREAALAASLSLFIVACGGGGNADSAQAQASSLVPAAPPSGNVIYADATALRPLKPGATWTYRGTAALASTGRTSAYTDVVTQSSGANGVVETSTNYGNAGGNTNTVSVTGGTVHTPQHFQLDATHGVEVDVIELRSPVVQNDQYTLYDGTIESGTDIDGDGKNDPVQLAVYTRVVGAETINLPQRSNVSTVHMVSTIVSRVLQTKTGTYTAPVTSTTEYWYAPNLGIVKIVDTQPVSNGGKDVRTEVLDSWTGLGNV